MAPFSIIFRHILKHDSLKRMVSEVDSTLYFYCVFTLVLNFIFKVCILSLFLNSCVFTLNGKNDPNYSQCVNVIG